MELYILQKPSYSDLKVQPSAMFSMDFRAGALDTLRGQEIIDRLNDGIAELTDTRRQAITLDYTSRKLYQYGLSDYLYQYTIRAALKCKDIILLIMAFTGRITSPLQKLTNAAEQISEGYYETELDYDKKDEVGILTASFKKLITNLNVYIKNLNDMAYIDALTGIGNRLALRRDYDSYQGREVTVLMLDLNDFKLINDTRGHEEGDRVLQEIGKLLSDTFGKEHCYRYGGDEFLVVVPDISSSEFNEKLEILKQNKPAIGDTARAGFAFGFVRATLTDSDILR